MPDPLNVLFVSAEAEPLVKVGGLGDVAGSLPRALRSLPLNDAGGRAIDVRLVIPFHSVITHRLPDLQLIGNFQVPHPSGPIPARVFMTKINQMPVYLIEGPPILSGTTVYSTNPIEDGEKYIFFSLASLELATRLDWKPDILHFNDWHTAIAAYELANRRKTSSSYARIKSVLSIHNLPFMGGGAETVVRSFGIPPATDDRLPVWARSFPLPLGLLAADHIIAVSPTYAQEILAPEFGCGLQDFLKTRSDCISGILNGIDEKGWDPSTDTALAGNFSVSELDQRLINKKSLLEEFQLPYSPNIPLLIMIGRIDNQKGMDLAIEGLRMVTDQPWQAILLGTGDPLLESAARSLEVELPDRVRAAIRFDLLLSHRMYAGGDMLLMPSRYEPCGLAQMIAMRYGCVPVARETGGLKDTIRDNREPGGGNGYLFKEASPAAFTVALLRALAMYPNRPAWQAMQIRGMTQDFSWKQSARAYAEIYLNLQEREPC